MPKNKLNHKGYVFAPLMLFIAFVFLFFIYVSYIVPSFWQPSPRNSGFTSSPKVTDGTLPSLTLNCSGLALKDGWCQATKQIAENSSHSYTTLYPQNYSVRETPDSFKTVAFIDPAGKMQYQVSVVRTELSSLEMIDRSENIDSSVESTFGKENYKALEVETRSGTNHYVYYIFDITARNETYKYLVKFDSAVDSKIISEVSSTFSVAVL